MQAISLQLKAFGPYNEEQHVRFEELGNESIFLITGPTGAGKTTIFDAICYALYGKASGSDREQDTLRSHFAEETDQTEVRYTFGLKGKQYQVIRTPRQVKKKARGEGLTEDPARAELYEIIDEEAVLLSAKVKDVNEMLEARLGLDYEQFRKMIMIPQGEFRRLISENSKEREEILQKIFRTHFYERMTEELKMQAKQLKTTIQDLERQLEQVQAKIEWKHETPEENDTTEMIAARLKEELVHAAKEKKEKENLKERENRKYKDMQEALFSSRQLKEKFEELDKLNKEAEELASKKEEIEKISVQLNMADRAERVKPYEEQVIKREKEWKQQFDKWETHNRQLKETENTFHATQSAYLKEKDKEHERESQKEQIQWKKNQLTKLQEYNRLETEANQEKDKIKKLEKRVEQEKETINKTQDRITEIEKQQEQRNEWTKAYYQAKEEEKNALEAVKKIDLFRQEYQELVRKREAFHDIQKQYNKSVEQMKQIEEKIAALEEARKKDQSILLAAHLQNGNPCPVCGSLHHPNPATGSSTSVSDDELAKWTKRKQSLESELNIHREKFHSIKSDGKYQRQRVDQLAKEAGIDSNNQDNWPVMYKEMEEKATLAGKQKENLDGKLKKLDKLGQERTDLKRKVEENSRQMEETTRLKEAADKAWITIAAKLDDLQKEIPQETRDENKVKKMLEEEEMRYQKLQQMWEELQKKVESEKEAYQQAITIEKQLKQVEKAGRVNFEQEEKIFHAKRQEAGFSTMEEYRNADMEKETKQELEAAKAAYEQRKETVESLRRELTAQLKDKQMPDLDGLTGQLDNQERLVRELQDQLQACQLYVIQHEQIAGSLDELHSEYQTTSEAYYDVGELANLAKGENHLRLSFERYVLASFLDEILLQANIRLGQLTEHRYQLIRSDQVAKRGAQSGLDLEVLDHHTGQRRSVKTLSGGEGFKAALSLALGMADVVQAHAGGVQLDTLFIDEGFGTLDELSLEQAIDCLKGLQQGNRVLGIISHVSQLKEEIPAKLQVTLTERGSKAEFVFR